MQLPIPLLQLVAADQAMPTVLLNRQLEHRRLREALPPHHLQADTRCHGLAVAAVAGLGEQATAEGQHLQGPQIRGDADLIGGRAGQG